MEPKITFTRYLFGADGSKYSVSASDDLDALKAVVRFARISGERPPRWYEVWRKRWPREAVWEYELATKSPTGVLAGTDGA